MLRIECTYVALSLLQATYEQKRRPFAKFQFRKVLKNKRREESNSSLHKHQPHRNDFIIFSHLFIRTSVRDCVNVVQAKQQFPSAYMVEACKPICMGQSYKVNNVLVYHSSVSCSTKNKNAFFK